MAFLVAFTPFFWNRSRKSKKFHNVRKTGDVSKQNGISRRYILFMMRIIYTKLQTHSLCCRQTKGCMQKYFLLQGLCVPGVKTTTYVWNRFNTSFCVRDHQTNQTISNLNRKFWNKSTLIWVDFAGVLFYPLCSNEITSLKNDTFIWIRIHILHLVYTTSLSDLCFNKKIEQKKKSLYKSISKSIYVDTYYLLFVIIVTECDVLSPSTKFSSLHHKKVVVLQV